MHDYRLYFLDTQGHIHSRLDGHCEDDNHAIAWVETVADGRPMELWQLGRFVRKFEAQRREA